MVRKNGAGEGFNFAERDRLKGKTLHGNRKCLDASASGEIGDGQHYAALRGEEEGDGKNILRGLVTKRSPNEKRVTPLFGVTRCNFWCARRDSNS